MWLNTPNSRVLEPACYIVSCLKLLAQWNEAFTSSALHCSLSCIPVQGGREWKIPPQASAPSVGGRAGAGWVAGGGRSVKSRDRAVPPFNTCPFSYTDHCLWTGAQRDLLKGQGWCSCSSCAAVEGHSCKAWEERSYNKINSVLGCSVFSFFHPWHLYNSTKLKLRLVGVVCVVGQGALNPVEFEKQKGNK